MGNHGRDTLTGRVEDLQKMEAVRKVLADAQPYGTRLGECYYSGEAREIAETVEGYTYSPAASSIELVVQVALYRWGGREWIAGRDLDLARAIQKVYWPRE